MCDGTSTIDEEVMVDNVRLVSFFFVLINSTGNDEKLALRENGPLHKYILGAILCCSDGSSKEMASNVLKKKEQLMTQIRNNRQSKSVGILCEIYEHLTNRCTYV